MNSDLSDIATGLSTCLTTDGQSTMTAQLKGFAGTVSAPGYTFSNDLNLGIYRIGADNLGIAANGAKVVDVATTGVSITGTLGASGNFAVNTDKFTVAAASGNTAVAGTLGVTGAATLSSTVAVTGNFSVNTDKFTVAAASGNTVVAGTLGVTGAATFTSSITAESVAGNMVATQAQQETGSSTTVVVTPGRQHFHKSAAKAWVKVNFDNPPVIQDSYGVTSVSRNGEGDLTVNFTTTFANDDYCVNPSVLGSTLLINIESQTTSAVRIVTRNLAGAPTNGSFLYVSAFGDT